MKIGCPAEVKNNENRVGLSPNAAHAFVAAGHEVFIQAGAGAGSAIDDGEYLAAGGKVLPAADEIWAEADMIVKVKEPLPEEYGRMRENQILFTYFHFAADRTLTEVCLKRNVIALAYETVEEDGGLPLLKPMSEVAGRMAAVMGAFYLGKPHGGRGILPCGATGVAPAEVLVVGGGTVGANAARVAAGIGCNVTILDINLNRLEYLEAIMPANVRTVYNDAMNLEAALEKADVVVGAVLIPGARAPKLIGKKHLKLMKQGAVLVDVAIDQGGCCETSHPTTHSDPVYVLDGILHYCVANMPGAYARTSTFALNNATVRYGLVLAGKGAERACSENPGLRRGLNMYKGKLTCAGVAEAFGMPYTPAESVLK